MTQLQRDKFLEREFDGRFGPEFDREISFYTTPMSWHSRVSDGVYFLNLKDEAGKVIWSESEDDVEEVMQLVNRMFAQIAEHGDCNDREDIFEKWERELDEGH